MFQFKRRQKNVQMIQTVQTKTTDIKDVVGKQIDNMILDGLKLKTNTKTITKPSIVESVKAVKKNDLTSDKQRPIKHLLNKFKGLGNSLKKKEVKTETKKESNHTKDKPVVKNKDNHSNNLQSQKYRNNSFDKKRIKRQKPINKMKSGIKGFDSLFKEGIPEGSSIIIEGGPGSGKTVFCLNFAHNMCIKGKKVLYMSFEEPEHRLINHMDDFGWDAEQFINKGLLKIQRFNALDISRSVEALLSEAKKELLIEVQPMIFPRDFTPDIVIIDSLTSISSAFSGKENRFRIYMEQLFRYLEKSNISSFLIREVSIPTHTGQTYSEPGAAVSFLSDGIIVIYNVAYTDGKRGMAIEVLKMRGEEIIKKIVPAKIIPDEGFVVYPNDILLKGFILT